MSAASLDLLYGGILGVTLILLITVNSIHGRHHVVHHEVVDFVPKRIQLLLQMLTFLLVLCSLLLDLQGELAQVGLGSDDGVVVVVGRR